MAEVLFTSMLTVAGFAWARFMFAVVIIPVKVIASSRVKTSTFLFVIFHLVFLVRAFVPLSQYKSFQDADSRVYPKNIKDIGRKTPTTTATDEKQARTG